MLTTARLHLRRWRDSDRAPFAAMGADARVMEFFPALQTREQSDRSIDHWLQHEVQHGFSNWAVDLRQTGEFIGFCGLTVPVRKTLPFMPCVEIGWRLAPAHWGQGYASEAARACLAAGFTRFGLTEIVSFTARVNRRSIAVMQRIGMHSEPADDFDHPALPSGHLLERHLLYRLPRARWQELEGGAVAGDPGGAIIGGP